MEQVVSAKQMKDIDRHAIEMIGIPSMVLMERAAFSMAEKLLQTKLRSFLVICGTGNNGGDGVAVARMMYLNNRNVTLVLIGDEGKAREVIQQMNHANAEIWAVDIASGISADTGETLGVAVKAEATVTFGWKKKGMNTTNGATCSGQVFVTDIGYPKASLTYGLAD